MSEYGSWGQWVERVRDNKGRVVYHVDDTALLDAWEQLLMEKKAELGNRKPVDVTFAEATRHEAERRDVR